MKLPVAPDKVVWSELRKLARCNWKLLATSTLLTLVGMAAAIAMPSIIGRTLDAISAGTTAEYLHNVIWVLAGLTLVSAIFSYFGDYFGQVLGEHVFQQLRDGLVGQLMRIPLSTVEAAGTGDMLGRVTHDISSVQYLVRSGMTQIIRIGLTLILTVVVAFTVSPYLAPLLLVSLPPLVILWRWYFPRAVPAYRAASAAWSDMSGLVSENADQTDTIEAMGMVPLRRKTMHTQLDDYWMNEKYTAYLRVFLLGGMNFSTLPPLLLIVLVGMWLRGRGMATTGEISATAMYVFTAARPLDMATFWFDMIQTSKASLARIFGVQLVQSDRGPADQVPTGRTWLLRGVTFSYGSGANVLQDVNLDIRPGERLAIVGTSGAGKSTLARLLAGFDGPTSGSVRVGGAEVMRLSERDLHKQVAVVTQEHHVFATTLAENLRLATPGATDDELWSSLETVGALKWARSLREGLDTKLGDGGTQLTDSQAQQLALARLVLIDPHTLILDEATAALNPRSARDIERSLGRVLEGRTVIMIAHRLFTAQNADRICVMDAGQIVELGSHRELLDLGGRYADLWHAWQDS